MHSHLVASLIPVALIICGSLAVATIDDVEEVPRRLEKFARISKKTSTGLTYDDYLQFYEAYKKKLGKKSQDWNLGDSPSKRLLVDFVLIPIHRWRLSINDGDDLKQAYVKRLEETYKHFWTSYVDHDVIGKGLMTASRRFLPFIESLINRKSKKEPTLEMWQMAKQEYIVLKKKAEEMVKNEDIYTWLHEYELMMNYFNDYDIKLIMDKFADRFDACKSEKKFKKLVEEFRNFDD